MKIFVQILFALGLLLPCSSAFAQKQVAGADSSSTKKSIDESYIRFDDTRKTSWPPDFKVVEIKSSQDHTLQKSYFYQSTANEAQPLIVSLHTWSGNYSQKDELAVLCKQKNLNYIHPDFRGVNRTVNACSSDLALADIDDAISFALENAKVNVREIYVIGVSGGGYATLASFMKSKHPVKKFSAWVPIADLEAWYQESKIMNSKYAQDILKCTDSKEGLNIENARRKSPLYMPTPTKKLKESQLFIYAGVYDGIQGSVPITHSINIYNKILKDMSVRKKADYVSAQEKLELLGYRRALGEFGKIADRSVFLKKQHGNVALTIFEGNHEMLPEYALNQLLQE